LVATGEGSLSCWSRADLFCGLPPGFQRREPSANVRRADCRDARSWKPFLTSAMKVSRYACRQSTPDPRLNCHESPSFANRRYCASERLRRCTIPRLLRRRLLRCTVRRLLWWPSSSSSRRRRLRRW
jgi:hypothetical protein